MWQNTSPRILKVTVLSAGLLGLLLRLCLRLLRRLGLHLGLRRCRLNFRRRGLLSLLLHGLLLPVLRLF